MLVPLKKKLYKKKLKLTKEEIINYARKGGYKSLIHFVV